MHEGNRSLMEEFANIGFAHRKLKSLNTMRKYKQLIHLSDIVCCDGKTVDRNILAREPGLESSHGFPVEWYIAKDYTSPSVLSPLQHIFCMKHLVPS